MKASSAILACLFIVFTSTDRLQLEQATGQETASEADTTEDTQAPVGTVGVEPTAADEDIAARLREILEATEWFESPDVSVQNGVVFLSGQTRTEEHRIWAGNLARNTQDVVAVVNRVEILPASVWDFSGAYAELRDLAREAIQSIPTLLASGILLLVTTFLAVFSGRIAETALARHVQNRLLRQVLTKAIAIPVLLLGIYLALRVSGLTRLAATVLGGTGLVGIILGIAFRDIAENFLASLLISIQSPYRVGDKIQVDGHEGIVQSVTTRGTQLMSLDGNHIQIPNSTIYKSVIVNTTSNPNIRLGFVVGIDYEDSAAEAQNLVFDVLASHDSVLNEPEPLILVEELAASTVNLRVYFWINGVENSMLKVRSSVMRLAKQALVDAGLTLPDESREVIFPRGVPVVIREEAPERVAPKPKASESDQRVSRGEGSLESEMVDIEQQAKSSRPISGGENLLEA